MCARAQNPQATGQKQPVSVPARPGSPALPGNKRAILDHCVSFNSYRLTVVIGLRAQHGALDQRSTDLGFLNVDPS
jgi:hypothetical protein